MTETIRLLTFMGENGVRYQKHALDDVVHYVDQMIKSKRVIVVEDKKGILAVIFFSICDDIEPFYKKESWHFEPSEMNGRICYIEMAVAREWSRQTRKQIELFLSSKYPDFEIGKWHRWGKIGDREVTARRYDNVTGPHII